MDTYYIIAACPAAPAWPIVPCIPQGEDDCCARCGETVEFISTCTSCGEPIDYCLGHGELG